MQNKPALLLTLSHNSSAIYFDGENAIGYETERLDRVKSSSASPIIAIKEIEKHANSLKSTVACVTHWFDKWNQVPESKYFTGVRDYCNANAISLVTNNAQLTHHDTHAWSAKSFHRHWNELIQPHKEQYIIVADGFGNFQETISIYKTFPGIHNIRLEHRVYGYETSLGLFYQYATDFCGMKMNQDEYKFLGYESMLQAFFTEQHSQIIQGLADKLVEDFMILFKERTVIQRQEANYLCGINKLKTVKLNWHLHFQKILDYFNIQDRTSEISRVLIANIIQRTIEQVLAEIIDFFKMDNILLAGGLFYNVKLNNRILKEVPGSLSIVPLAGDQGCAIGMYEKYFGYFNWDTLAIGKREMSHSLVQDIMGSVENVYCPTSEEQCVDMVGRMLANDQIVNLVTENMEFGPRALGNTSSLFQPSDENCRFVNYINDRNEVMPMAPMILKERVKEFFNFSQANRVVGSDKFMILTYDYLVKPNEYNKGVMHNYPLQKELYSGRPQVIEDIDNPLMYSIMKNYGVNCQRSLLTNTSYNYHGEPIVFSLKDILKTHYKQLKRAKDSSIKKKVNLVIYKG